MVGCLGGCIVFWGVGLTKFEKYADVQILSRLHVGEKAYPKLQHPQKSLGEGGNNYSMLWCLMVHIFLLGRVRSRKYRWNGKMAAVILSLKIVEQKNHGYEKFTFLVAILKFKLLQILVTSALKCLPKLFWIWEFLSSRWGFQNLIPGPIQLDQNTQVMMMKMQGKWPSITSVAESILHVKVQEQLETFWCWNDEIDVYEMWGGCLSEIGCGSYKNPRMKICFGFFETSHHWKDKIRWLELLCLWFCWVIF